MSNGLILFLLELIQRGTISSVTVTKDTVTIRIKNLLSKVKQKSDKKQEKLKKFKDMIMTKFFVC